MNFLGKSKYYNFGIKRLDNNVFDIIVFPCGDSVSESTIAESYT